MSYPVQKAAIAALTGPRDGVKAQCMEYQKEGYTSWSFCEALMDKAGVIGTPGTAFGPMGEGYIRFALVKPCEELVHIAEVIGESGLFA